MAIQTVEWNVTNKEEMLNILEHSKEALIFQDHSIKIITQSGRRLTVMPGQLLVRYTNNVLFVANNVED